MNAFVTVVVLLVAHRLKCHLNAMAIMPMLMHGCRLSEESYQIEIMLSTSISICGFVDIGIHIKCDTLLKFY